MYKKKEYKTKKFKKAIFKLFCCCITNDHQCKFVSVEKDKKKKNLTVWHACNLSLILLKKRVYNNKSFFEETKK